MSDEDPTQTGELGPMPDAEIEPPEPNPGGVDALPEETEALPADLDPADDAALSKAPDEVRETLSEGEDTDTKATKSSTNGDKDVSAEKDSPA